MKKLLTLLLFIGYNTFSQTDQPILKLNTEMHTSGIYDVSIDSQNRFILTVSLDKTAKLWNASNGALIKTFRIPIDHGNNGILFTGAISKDGKIVALSGYTEHSTLNFSVYIFDVSTGKLLQKITGLQDVVYALDFSDDDNYLAVGVVDYEGLVIYKKELVSNKHIQYVEYKKIRGYRKAIVRDLDFHKTGKLVTVCYDGWIRLYDKEFNLIKDKLGSGKLPGSVDFSLDGSKIAVGYKDATHVDVLSAETLELLYRPKLGNMKKPGGFNNVSFSNDGKYLYGAGIYHTVLNGNNRTVIRKWENEGQGGFIDYPTSKNVISKLVTVNSLNYSEDILFVGLLPEFGRISSAGKKMIYIEPELNDFTDNHLRLKVNQNADEIDFIQNQRETVTFSIRNSILSNKKWSENELLANKMLRSGKDEYLKKEYLKSIDYYKKGLQLIPTDSSYANTYFNLGLNSLALNNIDEALNYYKKGVELNQNKHATIQRFNLKNAIEDIEDLEKEKELINAEKIKALLKNAEITNVIDKQLSVDRQSGTIVSDWYESKAIIINNKIIPFEQATPNCVDISSDGQKIVIGTNNYIYCFDTNAEYIWETKEANPAVCVNISENNKYVVAILANKINWYNMQDGSLAMTLFTHPDNKRWILYTPDGYFDCTEGAEELAGWHINQGKDKEAKFYPMSQFYEKYYTPNLGARILAGEDIGSGENILNDFKLPPLVMIASPKQQSKQNKKEISVTVKVTDQGGGIDEIRLYHNGKLVETTQRGFKVLEQNNDSKTKTFTIQLDNGKNLIKATAFNNQRSESIPDEIIVNYSGVANKSNLYLLVVGIDNYKNTKYNLNYAVADATAFKNKLEAGSQGIFGNVNVTFIKDAQANRQQLIQEFNKLKTSISQEDVFIFYYAGHGVMSVEEKSQFYIIPHDVTKLYGNNEMLKTKAISAAELQDFSTEIKAQKQLFILDACQSGGMTDLLASRGAAEEKALAQLARSTGTYWLAASGTDQFATEFAQLKHGLFTYCILQGLQGQADGGSKDQKITVKELSSFLDDMVPELSEKHKGSAQYPNIYGYGMDFPLIIIK
ncbi:caspase family protein [Bacteroidota bacterium]